MPDMIKARAIGICDRALEEAGIPMDKRVAFLTHPDIVHSWSISFLYEQVLMFVAGDRSGNLHDNTCMLV
jgi:hypothetical protein